LPDAILSELIEVLTRPKFDSYLSKKTREELTDDLAQTALFIRPNERITECRDAKDNKYLELAVEGQAKCIITGDQDLLVLNPFREIAQGYFVLTVVNQEINFLA
jgi:putative PIN family toxin of toxin-antitoxin system